MDEGAAGAVENAARQLHELGLKDGECVAHALPDGTDHDWTLHLADARYIVGFEPVSNPDHLEDLNKGGDELRARKRQYDETGQVTR